MFNLAFMAVLGKCSYLNTKKLFLIGFSSIGILIVCHLPRTSLNVYEAVQVEILLLSLINLFICIYNLHECTIQHKICYFLDIITLLCYFFCKITFDKSYHGNFSGYKFFPRFLNSGSGIRDLMRIRNANLPKLFGKKQALLFFKFMYRIRLVADRNGPEPQLCIF
jgi:hypothetical protein